MTPSDHELLRRYAHEGSQAAFAALVQRHIDLVHSAARRQVQSADVAEEVSQSVFLDLAREARRFDPNVPVVAWLHLVTRRTAIDIVRRETRRQQREQQAAELDAMKPTTRDWTAVEPLLDEAVATLDDRDRTAILLRYFENKPLRDVGAALGLSDDAAQKRVSRAVEQLRAFFVRRGITIAAAGLAADLSARAVESAPATLGASIASAAGTMPHAAAAAAGAGSFLAMTTLQKSLAVAVLVTLGGTALFQARAVARQTDEIAALLAQTGHMNAELRALRHADETANAKLQETERRIDARLTAAIPATPADAALESQMQQWLEQVDRMKMFLAQRPEWNIPELKLLNEQDWFEAAATDPFGSDEQFRRATARLRDSAISWAQAKIFRALKAYLAAHDGLLPARAMDLAPYLDASLDPAILARYEVRQSGRASDVPPSHASLILAPPPADPEFDAYMKIGLNSYASNSGPAIHEDVREAERRFTAANNGRATTAEQLLPYLRWPVSADAVRKVFKPQPPATP